MEPVLRPAPQTQAGNTRALSGLKTFRFQSGLGQQRLPWRPSLALSQACSTCASLLELAWRSSSVSGGLHVTTSPESMVVNVTSSGHTFASDLFRCLAEPRVSPRFSSWEAADKPRNHGRLGCVQRLGARFQTFSWSSCIIHFLRPRGPSIQYWRFLVQKTIPLLVLVPESLNIE